MTKLLAFLVFRAPAPVSRLLALPILLLARWEVNRGGSAPDWLLALASSHLKQAGDAVDYVRRYERGQANALALAGLSLLALAALVLFSSLLPRPELTGARAAIPMISSEITLQDDLPELYGQEGDPAEGLALAVPASSDYSQSHGLSRHGAAAQRVRDCLAQNGPARSYLDDKGFRIHLVNCAGKVGVQVERYFRAGARWIAVTEYVKENLHTLREAGAWLERSGARLVAGQ